ncbi:MAG TPA: hypothetical protein VNC13_13515 [Propionibacteriaceae bacterium]|jgi:hypothetical protein|nr:hypothetical protein [Propionibacteriaceae bacterium]
MIDDASPEPRDSGTPSAQAPESYFWPLVALVLVILPQVLVPGRLREGPPLIVPVIEATVFPYCWRWWRNPGRSRAPPVR